MKSPQNCLSQKLPALCELLVADGVLNSMEASILRKWLSAPRQDDTDNRLDRIDKLVSRHLAGDDLSDDERAEILGWLHREMD